MHYKSACDVPLLYKILKIIAYNDAGDEDDINELNVFQS